MVRGLQFGTLFLLGGCLLMAPGAGHGQTGKPPAKKSNIPAGVTADTVLKKAAAALGGQATLAKMTSVFSKGEVSGNGTIQGQGIEISGTVETYLKFPGNYYTKQVITQKLGSRSATVTVEIATSGKSGWSRDPARGIRSLSGKEVEQLQQLTDLRDSADWRKRYAAAELMNIKKIGGRDAYMLKMTPKTGRPVMQYFDTQTYLMVRMDIFQEGPDGTVPVETYFSDYRKVGGIPMAFEVRQQAVGLQTRTRFSTMQVNVPIPASRFARPSG